MSDPNRPDARPGRVDLRSRRSGPLVRLLLVLGLLAGLVAMHGLGADHDMAMTGAHSAASGGGPGGMAEHLPDIAHTAPLAGLAVPADAPAQDHLSDMAQACVAVLAGAVALLLLLLGPLRALLSRRLPIRQPRLRARGRALLLRRPPDLSVLCVLRT